MHVSQVSKRLQRLQKHHMQSRKKEAGWCRAVVQVHGSAVLTSHVRRPLSCFLRWRRHGNFDSRFRGCHRVIGKLSTVSLCCIQSKNAMLNSSADTRASSKTDLEMDRRRAATTRAAM